MAENSWTTAANKDPDVRNSCNSRCVPDVLGTPPEVGAAPPTTSGFRITSSANSQISWSSCWMPEKRGTWRQDLKNLPLMFWSYKPFPRLYEGPTAACQAHIHTLRPLSQTWCYFFTDSFTESTGKGKDSLVGGRAGSKQIISAVFCVDLCGVAGGWSFWRK